MLIKADTDFVKRMEEDPIRTPDFLGSVLKRFEEPFEVYALIEKQGFGVDTQAVACVVHTPFIPQTEADLIEIAKEPWTEQGGFAVPYSLWSNKKGAGSRLINALLYEIKKGYFSDSRIVTMSPKTDMARRFHEKNGAFLLSENKTSNNFEYPIIDMSEADDES